MMTVMTQWPLTGKLLIIIVNENIDNNVINNIIIPVIIIWLVNNENGVEGEEWPNWCLTIYDESKWSSSNDESNERDDDEEGDSM